MRTPHRIIAAVLALVSIFALMAGCKGGGRVKVGYTISDDDATACFFLDREYALDASSTDPTKGEIQKAGKWLNDYVLDSINTGKSAFDFMIGSELFSEVLASWTFATEKTADTDVQTDYTLTYTKDGQPLTVTVYASEYKAYPIIEWTVWIENTGSEDSKIISDFDGLLQTFAQDCIDSEIKITTYHGSHEDYTSFMAEIFTIEEGKTKRVAGTGGKSSVRNAPYVNIQWDNKNADWGKEGVFVSTGWPGQWSCETTNVEDGVQVRARQDVLATYLKPGEKVRSPLITLLFWEKDFMRSQNIWRRWVYNIAMPQPGGNPIPTQLAGNTAQTTSLTETATTQNQVEAIRLWVELGLEINGWQMDAGWYEMANNSGSWVDTGNWYADPARFPEGDLSAIGAELAKNNIDFILWYEPERIVNGTDFKSLTQYGWVIEDTGWHCFNLANDEATDFLIEYIINSIKENGVTVYRQDANINSPSFANYWDKIEEEGQNGLAENQYIVNYLRYFDAILEATGTYIDNCASGGKRMDLESTKRAVALWRDDKCYEATLTQCQSWGVNFFMPYSGQGSLDENPGTMTYTFRSNMMQSTLIPWVVRAGDTVKHEMYRERISEYKTYSPYLTGDYYPLTAWSQEETDWMAWQYNDYNTTEGIIQVFKRPESAENSQQYWLSGLHMNKTYILTDIDTGDSVELSGRDLMVSGITVTISEEFDAKIFHYKPK